MPDQPIPGSDAHGARIEQLAGELGVLREEFRTLLSEIRANTGVTQDVRDILAGVKLGLKVLGGLGVVVKWVAAISTALASIYLALYVLTHNGVSPK